MSAHLLHILSIEEGSVTWKMTCEHVQGAPGWQTTLEDGTIDPDFADECWFWSWWDNVGSELVDINVPITTLPIPVMPGLDWDWENGGSITFDATTREVVR